MASTPTTRGKMGVRFHPAVWMLSIAATATLAPPPTPTTARASATAPTATFGTPVLIGSSNISAPGGSHFWFPSLSINTGIPGHVAQHITLSGDGGLCPLPGQARACDQIMLTKNAGRSYELVEKVAKPSYSPAAYVPTSGNFNGYGDLGTWVPPKRGAKPTPGLFRTIVGCNDCLGGSLRYPTYMQTWADENGSMRLISNSSVTYNGTPAAFMSDTGCPGSYAPPPAPPHGNQKCGLRTPSQTIIRMSNNELLMAFYGHAADGPKLCGDGSKSLCLTTAFYTSADDGHTWVYASRIDHSAAMGTGIGPGECSIVLLPDGRVFAAFRITGGQPLWSAFSSDFAHTWTDPVPLKGSPGVPYAVWPQLKLLSNGVLVLASGRPGIGLWVAPTANPENVTWIGHDVQEQHTKHCPSDPWTEADGTTSYTGIAEPEPGVVLLAYDKIGKNRVGDIQKVYSVRIAVSSSEVTP